MTITGFLADEAQTIELGEQLAPLISAPALIYFHGDLGAGKTTFVRAWLRSLGIKERIKSPTFSIVEPYTLGDLSIYHFDLYRIADPDELEFLGFRDYCAEHSLILVEWPEKAEGALPEPDILIHLSRSGSGREVRVECLSHQSKAIEPQINTLMAHITA